MKQFGRSLLNPTRATARRNFSVGALLERPPKSAQQEPRDDDEQDRATRQAFRDGQDRKTQQAFRDAQARSDSRPAAEAVTKARRRDGRA